MSTTLSRPASALGQLLWCAPLFTSEAADLRRGTWTFKLPAGVSVQAGSFAVVSAQEIRNALREDATSVILREPRGEVEVDWYAGYRSQGISIIVREPAAPGSYESGRVLRSVSLYRDLTPRDGRDDSWSGPAVWWGREARVDAHGEQWDRSLRMITDDFGDLVQLPAEFRD